MLPDDGSALGNMFIRYSLDAELDNGITEDEYNSIKNHLLSLKLIKKGKGKGGSISKTIFV